VSPEEPLTALAADGGADDMIRIQDRFYILATSDRLDDRTQVLKCGETFAVFDRGGDIRAVGRGEQGLYSGGTRYLSRFELSLAGSRLLLLGSSVRHDAAALSVDVTNPDLRRGEQLWLERGRLHVRRHKTLGEGAFEERIEVSNFGMTPAEVSFAVRVDADFSDIFEVRGFTRAKRGQRLPPEPVPGGVAFGYRGLDGVERRTRVESDPPARLEDRLLVFELALAPKATEALTLRVECEHAGTRRAARPQARAEGAPAPEAGCRLETASMRWNEWLHRSTSDLAMMVTPTEHGPYPYAGIPWFSTPFGRDGIITALERLWLDPGLARGVLGYLAATQSHVVAPERDAQPGKILHEARLGELAALGEVPFGRYYGSVDATPLFVILAGAYFARTADFGFAAQLWPHVEAALDCIERDTDERGFLVYERRSPRGLANQGWKDAGDSVFHADGALAEPPIALCEVQAYVYGAKREAAVLARAFGRVERAERLEREARALAARFEHAFWCEDIGSYALALDGAGRPCRVRASNAGQCLFTGIASPEHARQVAATLLSPEHFSGWGIRTVATTEPRYNPMSYHNGSVWPHDNALIAAGFSRYRLRMQALRLLEAWFDASLHLDLRRMPELICGFERMPEQGPTGYPLACIPQSWAAGAVFLLLQSVLGLGISAARHELRFESPMLPVNLRELWISGLAVGEGRVDVEVARRGDHVVVHALRREGEVRILVES
jgi:glycogen debranching enzyme